MVASDENKVIRQAWEKALRYEHFRNVHAIKEARKNKTITKPDGSVFEYDHNGEKRRVVRVDTLVFVVTRNRELEFAEGYWVILPVEERWEGGVLVEEKFDDHDASLIQRIVRYTNSTGDNEWIWVSKKGRTFYRSAYELQEQDGYRDHVRSFHEAERDARRRSPKAK